MTGSEGRRVVIVTGGGGGIGAAVASELGRRGDHVVTLDPMVTVDGAGSAPAEGATTAAQIVAAGGSAEASNASVTDCEAVHALVERLVATHGRLDAIVNVAGITRPTGVARGDETDWAAVLSVHLDGYQNVLEAALPHMAAAGRGQVLGVTSGSGWRPADAGAYSAAKRAVASTTWQLGQAVPAGVSVNAVSPIAMTRMVAAAMARAGRADRAPDGRRAGSATGGLALGGMPSPAELAPFAAFLAGPGAAQLRGRVLFAGGSEVAIVDPPRLLEVVRTGAAASVDVVLDGVADAWAAAEGTQQTTGGANPRFADLLTTPDAGATSENDTAVLIVDGQPAQTSLVVERLQAQGTSTRVVTPGQVGAGFESARAAVDAARAALGRLDAIIVLAAGGGRRRTAGWEQVLDDHSGLAERLLDDARWLRAAADSAGATGEPLRLVTVIDAIGAGGRSRAQAASQLARSARSATEDRLAAFVVSVESDRDPATMVAVARRLATAGDVSLSGAELVVGDSWAGLRSHPRPAASVVLGDAAVPDWLVDVLEELCR